MESTIATVLALQADTATVAVDRKIVCARCASGRGCGAGLFTGSAKPVHLDISLQGRQDLREGDKVQLTLEPERLLHAAFLVYGLPLAGIVLALVAGWMAMGPLADGEAMMLAIGGLLTGLAVGRMCVRQEHCLKHFVPRITALPDPSVREHG